MILHGSDTANHHVPSVHLLRRYPMHDGNGFLVLCDLAHRVPTRLFPIDVRHGTVDVAVVVGSFNHGKGGKIRRSLLSSVPTWGVGGGSAVVKFVISGGGWSVNC